MPNYKLIYFNARGRAEVTRLIFAEVNAKYEDIRIGCEEWCKLKPTMPFGQVPVLDVDGQIIPQSRAIAKFIAREFHLDGKDSVESALCDAYVDGVKETMIHILRFFHEKDNKKKEELKIKFREEHLKPFLDRYEKFLEKNSSGYFVGQSLTWADLYIFNSLQNLKREHSELLDKYPNLQKFMVDIANRPNIKQWLENRPETEA